MFVFINYNEVFKILECGAKSLLGGSLCLLLIWFEGERLICYHVHFLRVLVAVYDYLPLRTPYKRYNTE